MQIKYEFLGRIRAHSNQELYQDCQLDWKNIGETGNRKKSGDKNNAASSLFAWIHKFDSIEVVGGLASLMKIDLNSLNWNLFICGDFLCVKTRIVLGRHLTPRSSIPILSGITASGIRRPHLNITNCFRKTTKADRELDFLFFDKI